MKRTVKISPKKSAIKGSLKADFSLLDERVGVPIFIPQNDNTSNVFLVSQYTHLDSDGVTFKPVGIIDNVVEILHKTRIIITVQVVNPEDQLDVFNVQNIRFKWYKNGSYLYEVNNLNDFKGTTSIQFTEEQCTPAISGIYTVEATNDTGTAVSGQLVLRVHDPVNMPELYGNLVFNSSGEADLDGWTPSPGISVQQFFSEDHDLSFGENASIPRIQKMRVDWLPEEVKVRLTQPTGHFAFKKHSPYSFGDFYKNLQSHIASVGGAYNYDPDTFASTLNDWQKWRFRYKMPNLVSNENNGVEWGNPNDFYGSFFPSKDYLDEYNNNVQSSLTAEGILPGWGGSMGTYFTREPIKQGDEGTLTMNQQMDVSNLAGFINGDVCGVDKVVGNLFAYVGIGIDSYHYRVVFDDIHKSVPQDEQLLRQVIQKVNTWDADLRYWVEGYDTAWWDRGSRNPIPNIYRAPTLKQRSSYMQKIHPTVFDSVGAWQFTNNTDGIDVHMSYRSSSITSRTFGFALSTGNEGMIFNLPQFSSNRQFYVSESITTETREVRTSEVVPYNANATNRYTKHLIQDFGYLDDDWNYTSAPFLHVKDINIPTALSYFQGNLNKGLPADYTGSWNWFGPTTVYAGFASNGRSTGSGVNPNPNNRYLASSYVITARYLNSLSILTGGREGDPTTGAISKIPESSVLNFTNLRYKSGTPIEYQAAVPLLLGTATDKFVGRTLKSSDWRDFNPPTHTISPDIEENKGIYFYQRPDAVHPEGHQTDPTLIDFLNNRSSITLGFNCDFFAKAAALVPGAYYGPYNGGNLNNGYNDSLWVENGFYVEKTVGEFSYEPPNWRYPLLKKLYETSIGSEYEYSSFLSDFAIIFHRLLMIQNINQAHPNYNPITNRYPIKNPIESDLYLDAISRTIGSALPFTSDAGKRNVILNNQYRNLPTEFKLVSPSLYYQDKYVSYVHDRGYAGGRNTGYGPSGDMPNFSSDNHIASREAALAVDPSIQPDITPLPTSGEGLQVYIDKVIEGLNTRFEDAEEFIMNFIIKPLNDDLFQIPNIENLNQDDLELPEVKTFISAIHLFSTNRTHLAGGNITTVNGAEVYRFQEGTGVDTNDSYEWYHKQFGSQTKGAIGVNFGKPVAETNISNYKLFSSLGTGPLQGFYQNQTVVNAATNQIESVFTNIDASTYDEKTGAKRLEGDVQYQKYTPTTTPSSNPTSFRLFSNADIKGLSYPTSSGGSYDLLGVYDTSNRFNRSAISGSDTLEAKASRFPFYPSLDFKNRIRDYAEEGVLVLNAPRLTYQPEVPTAEIKSAIYKELPLAHAGAGSAWYDMSPEQEWHEYIRRAMVYWIYTYRGGTFAPETGDTLLMPAAPDIELNTTMLSAENLLTLQKDVTGYPLKEYRHILTGVHDNISRQGARIEVTPRADNLVKFVVNYLNDSQEPLGQDILNGPTVDDIFAVKEKVFLPTILGSLIQKTCILPDIRPVPVLYNNIELFSVTNTDIISPVADFVEKYTLDGFLEEHGVSSGAIVSEVLSTAEEDRDSVEWKEKYDIVSRLCPDRGAAAFFAVQKKLFLPKGTTSLDLQIIFENNSLSRNAPNSNQGDIKYEADTIPAIHTTYPYMFYEHGYPRTGVCLVKLCLYDNEFKRTRKYPQYYIPQTHVWSAMKQTMLTYGPLAYLQGYSILGRYGQAQSLFNEINYRVPDRTDLTLLQQGQRTITRFVFTPQMQELFRNNGYIIEETEDSPPTIVRRAGASNEVYDLTTVNGIEAVLALHSGLLAQQQISEVNNGTISQSPPGYQQIP